MTAAWENAAVLNADTLAVARQQGTDLLALGERRMAWLSARQGVLAQNIANADTPGYTPKDVSAFQNAVDSADVEPVRTNAAHFGVSAGETGVVTRPLSEQSLDGNRVSMDQELEAVADVEDQQHLAVNLYSKYMTMFQTVLGK